MRNLNPKEESDLSEFMSQAGSFFSCWTREGATLRPRPVPLLLTSWMREAFESSFPGSVLATFSCLFAGHRTHGFPVRALIRDLGDGLHSRHFFPQEKTTRCPSLRQEACFRLRQAKRNKGAHLIPQFPLTQRPKFHLGMQRRIS